MTKLLYIIIITISIYNRYGEHMTNLLVVTKKELENPSSIHNFKKLVKVRKKQWCIRCNMHIKVGDTALVHQYSDKGIRYVRNYYCKNCYMIK